MNLNYWNQFSATQKNLLTPVLLQLSIDVPNSEQLQAAEKVFYDLIGNENNQGTVEDKFLTIQNLVVQIGSPPTLWKQIKTIVGVATGYLEIRVVDRDQFLGELKNNGFVVNSWMEKIARLFGGGHKFDSARAKTETRFDPELHFANDRANEENYGKEYFFVHWDAQSVFPQRTNLWNRIAAASTHHDQSASPQEVAKYLQQQSQKLPPAFQN